ncbi:UNVERIFIED_CONTAM: hypothetical protein PYX00_003500 [Menopon gallinae]|uniref:Uncharacterized protein n=1 Tax=Menopon gallinae TaxID=328185 RepID=A0AAW2I1V5_9NEOP
MEGYREIEAIRRPGSPQLEVTKVRGSWRDYLDPVEYSDLDVDSQLAEDFDLGEHEYYDYEYDDDTCGECENDGDETDTDMEGLDLALFEPAGDGGRRRCRRCCCSCLRRLDGDSGFLMMLSDHPDKELQIGHKPSNAVKDSRIPLVTWEPYFCVLLQDEQTLTAYRSEELSIFPGIASRPRVPQKIGDALFVDLPRIRLDGGAKAFRQRWGYEVSPPPTLLEVEEEEGAENEDEGETVSLREEGIIPTSSPLGKSSFTYAKQVAAPGGPIAN